MKLIKKIGSVVYAFLLIFTIIFAFFLICNSCEYRVIDDMSQYKTTITVESIITTNFN